MSDSDTLPRDMTRAQLVEELRRMRPAFARLGVTGVSLFGSRAREDNRRDSDVDLIIDIDRGCKFSLLDLVGVKHAIEDQIGLPANVFMRRSLEADFLEAARAEELVILGG